MTIMSKTDKILTFLQDKDKMHTLTELLSAHKFEIDTEFKDEKIKYEDIELTLNGKINIKLKGDRL